MKSRPSKSDACKTSKALPVRKEKVHSNGPLSGRFSRSEGVSRQARPVEKPK